MMAAVTTALSTVITWIATVVKALVGTVDASGATVSGALAELLPLFAIGISISAFLLGIRAIKSLVWGS